MGTEQFSLKWNNHTRHVVGVFESLLQSESLVDVTLSCEGQSLKAHKLVLSACSPYFKTLFQDHSEAHPIVILKDVKFTELRSIIQFMYKGEVEVDQNEIESLICTAEGLMIRGLAGSRSTVSGLQFPPPAARHLTPHQEPPSEHARKRARSDPDSGGGGAGGEPPPPPPPAGLPVPTSSNGEDTSVIKRPKIEDPGSDSGEENNSVDGLDSGMVSGGTTYLCPECGLSFGSQHLLHTHRGAAHAERQTVVREPAGRTRLGPDEPLHSHSWPPHDHHRLGDRLEPRFDQHRMGERLERRLDPRLDHQQMGERLEPRLELRLEQRLASENRLELPERMPWDRPPLLGDRRDAPLRLPLHLLRPQHDLNPFLPPLGGLGNGRGLLPGLLPGLRRHLTPPAVGLMDCRSPLDLTTVDGTPGTSPPAASPSGERSAPSTPTPTEDGNPVTCKYCTRMFESIAALMDHMPVHQGDRPFLCEWCKKAFKFRHHLKDHCRIHTGERPFECRTCGKTFARSSILKTHTKIHRQEAGRRFEMVGPFPSLAAPENQEMPLPGTTLPEMPLPGTTQPEMPLIGTTLPEMPPMPNVEEGAAQAQ